MANVCSRCSTENADGVLTCRQCGATLASPAGWSRSLIPEDDTFDPLSAPTLVMQHTAPAALPDIEETQPVAPEVNAGRRLVWGLAGFLVLIGAGLWLMRPSDEVPAATAPAVPAQPASAPAASLPSPASEQARVTPPAEPASAARATEPAELALAPAASAAAAAAVPGTAPAASGVERRKRIPEPVVRRPVPASAPVAPASQPVPPPPPAPVAEAVRPRTVADLCAPSSVLARPFCEHRECAKSEHAGDPVCVRLKEAEEARRSRQ